MPEPRTSHRWCIILITMLLLAGAAVTGRATPQPAQQTPLESTFATMRRALYQTLRLRFEAAIEVAASLEDDHQPTLASRLTRGMIAYFQTRWQTPRASSARTTGHQLLQEVLAEDRQHRGGHEQPEGDLFRGLAAVFDGLLQQSESSWSSMQLFNQGRTLLEQTLIAHDTMTDAHLGLGLLYFAGTEMPALLRPLLGNLERQGNASEAIRHLRRAADRGHFSPDVARTFLARVYELEQQYEDAIEMSQKLSDTFPTNGYYALITGRSQCARSQYTACANTLEKLARSVEADPPVLNRRSDRFSMYYHLGRALKETHQYDKAFDAFRQAIKQDPHTLQDDTLWAKYHLATLYERRGQTTTARQMYRHLLKSRNVENLHHQAQQRLAHLR
jgi:tetratricopeptide (TPR) repeat protein